MPYYRPLRGFHVDRFWGEAAFVPTEDFMRESPLWRIDVLDDIAEDIRHTRTHALVACFRECQARGHDVPIARQIEAFREVCKMALHCQTNWRRCSYWISNSADQPSGAPETQPRGDH